MKRDIESCNRDELLKIINGCIKLLNSKFNAKLSEFPINTVNDEYDDEMSTDFDDTASILSTESRKKLKGKRKAEKDTHTSEIPTKNRYLPLQNENQDENVFEVSSFNVINSPHYNNNDNISRESQRRDLFQNSQLNANAHSNKNNNKMFSQQIPKPLNDSIPPINLTNKSRWVHISKLFKHHNINYTRATNTKDGIRIMPSSIDDHRSMTKLFDKENIEYHTYRLPDEKSLMIVIRGVPVEVEPKDVEEDLIDQGFSPIKITRMTNRRTKAPMPLVLVQLPRSEKRIYDVETIAGMVIQVETLRASPEIVQCFRCQKYGHGQAHCKDSIKCVKCGECHRAYECTLTKNEMPKCANCGEQHVASYRGCSKAPKPKKNINLVSGQRQTFTSYADAAKQPQKSNNPPNKNQVNHQTQSTFQNKNDHVTNNRQLSQINNQATIVAFNQLIHNMTSMFQSFQEKILNINPVNGQ